GQSLEGGWRIGSGSNMIQLYHTVLASSARGGQVQSMVDLIKCSYRVQAASVMAVVGAQATAPLPSWTASVDAALGRHGTMNAGGVYKFGFPRSDIHASVEGVQIKPALALGSWVAFKAMASGGTMAMGDLV